MVGWSTGQPYRQGQYGEAIHLRSAAIAGTSQSKLTISQGRNNAIKLLKLDLPLMGPEAVMDGLTRQL